MDFINDKLLIELYNKYINDNQYVYYKERNIIIIMKKLTDDNKCLSDIEPKKYHSSSLKVILMFNKDDPYKLVSNTSKYNINKLTESYYYESIKEACILQQEYYESGQLKEEYNYIDGKRNGLYQLYYESGQLWVKCNYINDKRNGLFQLYYDNDNGNGLQLKEQCNLIDGKINGLYHMYYTSGQKYSECNYINDTKNGLHQEYYKSGQLNEEYNYINGSRNGLYQQYYKSGQLLIECNYINNKKNGLYQEYYESGQIKETYHFEYGILKS
jgi:antitoxin component YwqK of YwqJK toxin-antitoxin module